MLSQKNCTKLRGEKKSLSLYDLTRFLGPITDRLFFSTLSKEKTKQKKVIKELSVPGNWTN